MQKRYNSGRDRQMPITTRGMSENYTHNTMVKK